MTRIRADAFEKSGRLGNEMDTAAVAFRTPVSFRSRGTWWPIVILLCALAWIGHRLVFAQFQVYDDEGYLMITVEQFLQGNPLYDDVYTQYGPAYYLWEQVLHGVLRIPVTHSATRLITLVVWLGCSALAGIIVWLLTKRLVLTAIGAGSAFFHMTQLTFEPGHPQELCLLGVIGCVVIATWRLVTHRRLGAPAMIAIGALAALVVLTKANVGGFLIGAMTLGLVTGLRNYRWRAGLIRVVAVGAFVAVLALMHGEAFRSDIAAWIVVVWSGLLAVFGAGSADSDSNGVVTVRELTAGTAGFAITSTLVIAATLAGGTSLPALFDGLVVWPLRLPAVFWRPLPVPLFAALVAVGWLFVALLRRRKFSLVQRWIPSIGLACGLILFVFSITKSYGLLLALGPPVAWLVLAVGSSDAEERAARRILAFAAILVALQTYPMPDGTQIVFGTLLFLLIGLVILADAQRALHAQRPQQPAPPSAARRATLAMLVVVVATATAVRVERIYAEGTPLGLPGTGSLRATERSTATYRWLAANLREHCDGFLTAPGLNSLHFWTGIPPVSTLNATLWPILFDSRQQDRVLAAAMPVARLCVGWQPRRMEVLMRIAEGTSQPLVAWLMREFEPVAAFGDWEFRVRRGSRPALVYQGRIDKDGLVIELPPLGPDRVTRVAVVDVDAGRVLADSASGAGIRVIDEHGVEVQMQTGIDVSRRRRIVLRSDPWPPASNGVSVVVRLSARDGRLLALIPVVTEAPGIGSS